MVWALRNIYNKSLPGQNGLSSGPHSAPPLQLWPLPLPLPEPPLMFVIFKFWFSQFCFAYINHFFFYSFLSFLRLFFNCKFYIAVRSVKVSFDLFTSYVRSSFTCEMLDWRSALFPQPYSPCASRAITAWSCLMTEEKAYGITVT